jgi:biopolymer transport protein ExbB/TolQ
MKELLMKYYMEIIVIVCGIIMIALWQNNLSNIKELDELKKTIAVTEEINKLDSKLADMKKREAELYPLLQKKENELTITLNELDKKRLQLDKIKKEQVKYEINKMDINAVSNLLTELGYTNTVISK